MDWSRELQPADEVDSILKPKIQAPPEEQAAVKKAAPKKKKKETPLFQPTVDYSKQGKDLPLMRYFICLVLLGSLFFAFSFWIRTPDEQIIHEAAHLRRARAPKRAVRPAERSARGYSVAY